MTIRILLVDDHKTMLWGLERLIQAEGAAFSLVGSASEGIEARQLCASLKPDIVLLDLDLKGSSSIDFLPDLIANGVTRVVILSANRDQATLAAAVKAGPTLPTSHSRYRPGDRASGTPGADSGNGRMTQRD